MKVSRCSEMIYVKLGVPKEKAWWKYKNKTLSRDSLGARAHLDVPVSSSHKTPTQFCSVHHLKMPRNHPGSHTNTSMDIPTKASLFRLFHLRCFAFQAVPLVLGSGSVSHLGTPSAGKRFALRLENPSHCQGRAVGLGSSSKETPKHHQNPATLLMQKTTPHRPIFWRLHFEYHNIYICAFHFYR